MDTFTVVNNRERQEYEITADGETAFLEYRFQEGVLVLMHTEVPEKLAGRGIGTSLAAYAFRDAKEQAVPVKVYCPFVLAYLKRHPELAGQLVK